MPTDSTPENALLTPFEARAIRLAVIFGSPTPKPPEITSALAKLAKIEAKLDGKDLTDGTA